VSCNRHFLARDSVCREANKGTQPVPSSRARVSSAYTASSRKGDPGARAVRRPRKIVIEESPDNFSASAERLVHDWIRTGLILSGSGGSRPVSRNGESGDASCAHRGARMKKCDIDHRDAEHHNGERCVSAPKHGTCPFNELCDRAK
jgi:hypothetical protein